MASVEEAEEMVKQTLNKLEKSLEDYHSLRKFVEKAKTKKFFLNRQKLLEMRFLFFFFTLVSEIEKNTHFAYRHIMSLVVKFE